jgi:hypothetical protein
MVRSKRFGAGLVLLIAGATAFATTSVQKEETIRAASETAMSVMTYTMASPRAFLMGIPVEGSNEVAMLGAVENFPRAGGTLEIPAGTRVIFSLSPETEGVWQQGTYGTIETTLTVQSFQAVTAAECGVCISEGLRDGESIQPGKGDLGPCPWITIGTEGARDTRNGPSLGYTKVGVPIEFTQLGTWCVRGIVSTSVKSSYLRPAETQNPTTKQEAPAESSDTLLAIDTDVVLVTVRVVPATTKAQGALTADPEVIYTAPMPSMADTKAGAER